MKKSLLVMLVLLSAIIFLSNFTIQTDSSKPFHTPEELELLSQVPIGPGEYFQPSSSCRGCHGFDTLAQANIDENGVDVNLFDRWETTMMAMSAKDPLWRAKVSHEIMINPAHSTELQTKCTSCHAPMGHYTAMFHGATSYTIADLVNDSLGLDGVSCAGCHTIGDVSTPTFSGEIPYDTTRQIFGPFPGPFAGPMQLYEGYTPVYSPHMDESAVCASCHTLIAPSVDNTGAYTGVNFIEQATYHEYVNSSFPANDIKCQTCHMPQLPDPVIIANGYISLQGRAPFNQHTFAGANKFMVELIKNNKSQLNITASDAQFDSTISATLRMLQEQSIDLDLISDSITNDTAYYRVKIRNKAGHKFPSGYPSRRAVIQFIMTDAVGDTIFRSGIFDSDYRVTGENSAFEPHHEIISNDNVPQIYEMVMGDVNGQFTSVLERANILLKDNRIPPDGFTSASPVYDTVQVSADAVADADFNKLNSVEGTGTDYVHYRIPVTGLTGTITAVANLYYQSVPPKWLDEMFAMNSGPIDTFKTMYQGANKSPVLSGTDTLVDVLSSINPAGKTNNIRVFPTLCADGNVNVQSYKNDDIILVELFNTEGKKLLTLSPTGRTSAYQLKIPQAKGTYFVRIHTKNNYITKKILRL